MQAVTIKYKTVGPWKENSYCVQYKDQAFLVDPGDEFELLENEFNTKNLKIYGILSTHGHFDHIGAVSEFKNKYELPFYLHSKDKQILRQANLYKKLAGKSGVFETPSVDFFLDDISELKLGEEIVKIHHTPGHTNGSVCFELGNNLLSGDLLFKDAIGRVDLPGGNSVLLAQSIQYVINNFMGYMIFPGHGLPFNLTETEARHLKSLI